MMTDEKFEQDYSSASHQELFDIYAALSSFDKELTGICEKCELLPEKIEERNKIRR